MRFVIEAVGLTAGGGKELALDLFSRLHLFREHEFILFVPGSPEYSAIAAPNVKCIQFSGPGNLLSRYWALQRILPWICHEQRADALLCLGNFVPNYTPCPASVLIQNAYLTYGEPIAERRLTGREKLVLAYNRRALQSLRRRCIRVVVQTPVMRERIFSMQARPKPPHTRASFGEGAPISTDASHLFVSSANGKASPQRSLSSSVASVLRIESEGEHGGLGLPRRGITLLEEPTIIPNPATCLGNATVRTGEHRDRRRPFTFLCLARYYAHKNLEILPQALKQLSSHTSQPFKCLITISAAQHPNARKLLRRIEAEGLGRVLVNVGPVARERLAETYRSADALILPTLLESYTRTYSEAMHYGLPILTSDRDFARHLCGEAAIYFDPLDPASAAKSMAAVMGDEGLRKKLIAAGQRRASELPRWDAVAAQFVAVLERAAGSSHQSAVASNQSSVIDEGSPITMGSRQSPAPSL